MSAAGDHLFSGGADADADGVAGRIPTPGTLRKYGLTRAEWVSILRGQGGVCLVCLKVPPSGRWVTDHEHIPKFKKLKPDVRRRYVRGIICSFCNSHCVGRFMTLEKARRVAQYLADYHDRLRTQHGGTP